MLGCAPPRRLGDYGGRSLRYTRCSEPTNLLAYVPARCAPCKLDRYVPGRTRVGVRALSHMRAGLRSMAHAVLLLCDVGGDGDRCGGGAGGRNDDGVG